MSREMLIAAHTRHDRLCSAYFHSTKVSKTGIHKSWQIYEKSLSLFLSRFRNKSNDPLPNFSFKFERAFRFPQSIRLTPNKPVPFDSRFNIRERFIKESFSRRDKFPASFALHPIERKLDHSVSLLPIMWWYLSTNCAVL